MKNVIKKMRTEKKRIIKMLCIILLLIAVFCNVRRYPVEHVVTDKYNIKGRTAFESNYGIMDLAVENTIYFRASENWLDSIECIFINVCGEYNGRLHWQVTEKGCQDTQGGGGV